MNISRLLLKILVALLKLAKQYKIKGREIQDIVGLIDDACEVHHSNDCLIDELENKCTSLANQLEQSQEDLGRKIKAMELNEEEYWEQRDKLTSLIDEGFQATGKNNEFRHATRHVLEEMQSEFPNRCQLRPAPSIPSILEDTDDE